MSFKCGIVGLPNVGKSTLFNALTNSNKAQAANFPFCTIDPNVGVVAVPDERLNSLSNISKSKKIINTTISFVDIAGLVKGASKGEGLGNQFLSHIREVDAIAHVVRCFSDNNITHVHDKVDPLYDLEIIESELILSDLERSEVMINKLSKLIKNGKKEHLLELALLKKVLLDLEKGNIYNKISNYNKEELKHIKKLGLLSFKPLMYVGNLDEENIENGNIYSNNLETLGFERNISVVKTSAKLEAELSNISDENLGTVTIVSCILPLKLSPTLPPKAITLLSSCAAPAAIPSCVASVPTPIALNMLAIIPGSPAPLAMLGTLDIAF